MAPRVLKHPEVNRSELAAKLNTDRGYLTNVLNGKRAAHLKLAVSIFKETGIKLGPLAGKSGDEVKALAKAASILGAAQ